MTRILRVDASPRQDESWSRKLGDRLEQALVTGQPGSTVVRRDLGQNPASHVTADTIAGFFSPVQPLPLPLQQATAQSDRIIAEVKAAETLLITTPIYNFTVPSVLKAWIDQMVRIGQTFSYDGANFAGLLGGRDAHVAVSYGASGFTGDGPLQAADFVTPYLRFLLQFLGIQDVHFHAVEGTSAGPDVAEASLKLAQAEIDRQFNRTPITA